MGPSTRTRRTGDRALATPPVQHAAASPRIDADRESPAIDVVARARRYACRRGRATSSPPQFGQIDASWSPQSVQNVHS
jgi:hypothetical protein